jgi:predicted Zn-dependent peptidase
MKIVNVNLPEKKDLVLVTVNFSHGYLNENDSDFGLAHLTEHYITTILEKKYDALFVGATINDDSLSLDLEFKRKYFEENFDSVESILNDIKQIKENISNKIILNEKKRIEIELEEKYSDVLNSVSYSIENKIVKTPARLKRSRLEQIKNVRRFTEKDIKKCIDRILKSETIVFVGFNGNTDDFPVQKNKSIDRSYLSKIELVKNKNLVFESNNKILKKASNYAVAFPLGRVSREMVDLYTLKFINKKLYKKFSENVFDLGVYKTEYLHNSNYNGGYIWYFLNAYNKIEADIDKIFFNSIKDVLNSEDLEKDLKEFKKNLVKDLKLDSKNFYGKFDWVISDILRFGKVNNLENIISEIEKITVADISRVAKTVFDTKEARIVRD